MRKMTRLLALVLVAHEWNARADGTPKAKPERGELLALAVYYLRGVAWKLRHPVTALCSVDGVTRPWLAALRRVQLKLLGRAA